MLKLNHWYNVLGGGTLHISRIADKYRIYYQLGNGYDEVIVNVRPARKYGMVNHLAALQAILAKRGKDKSHIKRIYVAITWLRAQ